MLGTAETGIYPSRVAWELFRAMHHHLHVSIDDSFHHHPNLVLEYSKSPLHRNGADGETSVPAMVRIANTPNHENKPGDASASY